MTGIIIDTRDINRFCTGDGRYYCARERPRSLRSTDCEGFVTRPKLRHVYSTLIQSRLDAFPVHLAFTKNFQRRSENLQVSKRLFKKTVFKRVEANPSEILGRLLNQKSTEIKSSSSVA
jgi:hypothetical protein